MPRRSASIHEKKIPSMPVNSQQPALPVISQRPSFLQTMKEGLALGVGSSIGHRIVSAAFGESTLRVGIISQAEKPLPNVTGVPPSSSEEYEQCMKKYDDIAACQKILAKN